MNSTQSDNVTVALREVEHRIDKAYKNNPLVSLPFAEAVWYSLAFCEEMHVSQFIQTTDSGFLSQVHEDIALADNVIVHAKRALKWLSDSCSKGGVPSFKNQEHTYKAAWDLSDLAMRYMAFESVFSYASEKFIKLELIDNRIIPSNELRSDACYEAYDRLNDSNDTAEMPTELTQFFQQAANSVQVSVSSFSYTLNQHLIEEGSECAESHLSKRFKLPSDWTLPRYTIGEFTKVGRILWILSMIHFTSRIKAVMMGCYGLGYSQALITMNKDELRFKLKRYSGVDGNKVNAIVEDLTYGARGQLNPDPALQPIIQLNQNMIAITPSLIINNDLDRNLIVLMNRLVQEREAYSKLSNQKESLLRRRFTEVLSVSGWRSWHGNVPGWKGAPDIDLAIISDKEKRCLFIELKSFLGPAEPREIIERSEEIARGIEQVRRRKGLSAAHPAPLHRVLGINADYELMWAVVSDTSIGGGWVQVEDVPVVRANHLIRKLNHCRNLKQPFKWLSERQYLPKVGRDFNSVDQDFTIGSWTLEWFGIELLVDDIM